MDYFNPMKNNFLKNWKPGPTDVLILAGAVVNAVVIAAILIYYFLGR